MGVDLDRRRFLGKSALVVGGAAAASAFPFSGALAAKRPLIDVRSRGAKGDGVTDDGRIIQDAIDEAVSLGGGRVYLPAGIYAVGAQLNVVGDGVRIGGDGPGSVIRLADRALANDVGRRHLLHVRGSRFRLHHLTIDGNGSNQTIDENLDLVQFGVESSNGNDGVAGAPRYDDLKVVRCYMHDAVTRHIRVNQCDHVVVRRNTLIGVSSDTSRGVGNIKLRWVRGFRVTNNECSLGAVPRPRSNNILVSHSGNSGSGSAHGIIHGNEVDGCTDSPIEASSSSSSSALDAVVHHVLITRNKVSRGAGIISLQSRDVLIEGNTVNYPGQWGGNSWGIRLGCGVGSDPRAVQQRVIARANTVVGTASGPTSGTKVGVAIQSLGGQVQDVSVEGNSLTSITREDSCGILVDGPSPSDVQLKDNTFVDVAQAITWR